jgi:uncharacterized protein YfaS (alpha-2-macroglobulin family)
MDLLRFIAMLPVRLWQLVERGARALAAFLPVVFGQVTWSAPPWTHAAAAELKRKPKHYAGGVLGTVVAAALIWSGVEWYLHRPHPPEPDRITFTVTAPTASQYEDGDGKPTLVVHLLEVRFSASAAPIELVGKTAGQGIAMDPAVKGKWTWVDDRTLKFAPAQDWPVGFKGEVMFDPAKAFAPHVLVAEDHFTFETPAFQMSRGTSEFYQDPQNPTAKKTIMQVEFNYPVDPAAFEKHVALSLLGRGLDTATPLKFTIVYDPAKMKAWIHSEPLALPRDSDTVTMTIDKGVASSRGGEPTADAMAMSVGVPGLYSLNIASVSPTLVNNDKYEPEQVLVVAANQAVRGSDMQVRAWVLPKRKPGQKQPESEPPYAWEWSEVNEDILHRSTPVKLDLVPTEKEYDETQSYKFHAEPGQHVFYRVEGGLKSFGGYILGKNIVGTYEVPDYPKLLHFMADGSLLSLSGDRHVSVVSRNVEGMKLEIGRVLPEQLQHLVKFNEGTYAKPDLSTKIGEDSIVERFEQTRLFPKGDPGAAHYEGLDLGQYLKDGKHGVFLLKLSAYAPPPKDAAATSDEDGDDSEDTDSSGSGDDTSDTRMVVITDLGLLAKKALDGSRDVFVQSIHTGDPVSGATVEVIAVNGDTLFGETSAADGMVHFPTFKGLLREKKPVMLVVRKGDDLSFLPLAGEDRKLDYSRFDVGGESNPTSEGELSAYLFSDRGIYRPGDLFHIGMIVRTANWAQRPAGIPLKAKITDPRGAVVRIVPVSVDASGFAELSYKTSETSFTGTWTIDLCMVGERDEPVIGSTTVSVKEFLPDSMKVDATLSARIADGWVKPDGMKGIVDVRNLFGTPAANRRVEASLTLNPTFPAFQAWPEYKFFDLRHAKDGYTTNLQDGKTDEQGHAEFDLDLKKYADATYRLSFLAKAYEPEGGRSVAASADTMVSSNPWLVGYRSADDLSYIKRGTPRSVRLVAIDPQTKSIELKGLQARLIERRYVSILTKQDSGVYKYESRLKEVPISANPLVIPAGGMDFALPTDKPGDYALVIRNGDLDVNRVEYSVQGDANLSRALDRNAELQVKLGKFDYAPGEAVDISLRAPYAGSGLITIERDKVYAHAWFKAATTNSVQHITVPKGFEGNGYINVQYIRDPSSTEIFMSPLSYGVAPFSVNVDARRDALTLDAPPLVKPGQTATFKLHAGQPTKVVVFAVDEGILQVAHYKLGDPLKFFFRKRMLEVQSSQILDLILPDFEALMAAAAPGGDQDSAIGRQLNPFKRRRDAPVAYWSGIVDVSGEKDFAYHVPDYFHGKLRVMAVAVSPDLIGTVESATTVRGDFVLAPDAPTTLAPGDEADIGVGVSNDLNGPANKQVPITIALVTGPQFKVIGGAQQTLSLAPMHESVATFRVQATDQLGSGGLTFKASAGGKSATQRIDVSIRPAAAFRTQLDFGRLKSNSTKVVGGLRNMYAPYSARSASAANVPLVLSAGLTSFLVNTDNYCTEQIVSATMPRLVAMRWASLPVFADKIKGGPAKLGSQIDAVRGRQNSQGGFGLWTATPSSEPFVSAYAMHFLLEARERGVAVPKDAIDAGNNYLRRMAEDDGMNSLAELRQRAYAVYLLTRQGNLTTNDLATVQRRLEQAYPTVWREDLAAAWLAASYRLLKQDKEADKLIAGLEDTLARGTSGDAYDYTYYDDPLIRDATVLYLLAKHFPERTASLPPRALDNIAEPLLRDRFNTLSAAMTMLALDTYAKANAGAADKLGIDQVFANGALKPIAVAQDQLKTGSFGPATVKLNFTNIGGLPAWTVIDQEGFDRDVPKAAIKNGVEIVRDYTDAKGNALDHVKLGEEIDVHLKIRATSGGGVGNLAIVDLLPGGFDPVLQTGQDNVSTLRLSISSWTPTYTDMREDRVVIYGSATPDVQEFVYRIKASASGRFIVPPAFGASMYDRRVQARAPGGAYLTVTR